MVSSTIRNPLIGTHSILVSQDGGVDDGTELGPERGNHLNGFPSIVPRATATMHTASPVHRRRAARVLT